MTSRAVQLPIPAAEIPNTAHIPELDGFQRTTPAQGSPERLALDEEHAAFEAERETLEARRAATHKAYERIGWKPVADREEARMKRNEAVTAYSAWFFKHERLHKRASVALHEDVVQTALNPISQLHSLARLGLIHEPYERAKSLLEEELRQRPSLPLEWVQRIVRHAILLNEPVGYFTGRTLAETADEGIWSEQWMARRDSIPAFLAELTEFTLREKEDLRRKLTSVSSHARQFEDLQSAARSKNNASARGETIKRAKGQKQPQRP